MQFQARLRQLQRASHSLATHLRADEERPRLQTAVDVVNLLEEAVCAARTDPYAAPIERARILGYLAGLALKAIEARNLAARVEMLEMVLKTRNRDDKR